MTLHVGAPARRRGQPLVVLGAVMLCWIGVRAGVWRMEPGEAMVPRSSPALAAPPPATPPPAMTIVPSAARSAPARRQATPPLGRGESRLAVTAAAARDAPALLAPAPVPLPGPGSQQAPAMVAPGQGPAAPTASAAPYPVPPPTPPLAGRAPPSPRRWSADAWALLRGGGGVASAGPSAAAYGASQVGAVLRFRPWPSDPHRPTAYFRVSAALNGSGEREAAAGLSVRPVAGLPVFVAGEARVGRFSSGVVVRPAVMAVTELAPVALPEGARAEFYLQGGYVGGRGATPFIDGQLRVDRKVARVGGVEARVGAGAWGGAQQGANRFDLGPTATLQLTRGPVSMRLGVDWRFRLAGSAEPASGPALTISAGF